MIKTRQVMQCEIERRRLRAYNASIVLSIKRLDKFLMYIMELPQLVILFVKEHNNR